MSKTIPEIIHEINEHIKAASNALSELEERTKTDKTATTVAELAKSLEPMHLS